MVGEIYIADEHNLLRELEYELNPFPGQFPDDGLSPSWGIERGGDLEIGPVGD